MDLSALSMRDVPIVAEVSQYLRCRGLVAMLGKYQHDEAVGSSRIALSASGTVEQVAALTRAF